MRITNVYFSATYTTRKVVEEISAAMADEGVSNYDITNDECLEPVVLDSDQLLVMGIPVYAGRVPAMAVERLKRFKGNGTPAIAVAVYGNRHYDDALVEMYDLLTEGGFRVVAAGAFIAQHSIFPKVGAQRPDSDDLEKIRAFAVKAKQLAQEPFGKIELPGNRPYKVPGGIAIWPTASKGCTECGKCASLCPTGAISKDNLRGVDREKCIKCGRCIVVCPTKKRRFWGIKYSLAARMFNSAFAKRREPEVFLRIKG